MNKDQIEEIVKSLANEFQGSANDETAEYLRALLASEAFKKDLEAFKHTEEYKKMEAEYAKLNK